MRILVYPHELTIGGSQINAIDLAAGVAAAGHEVVIYGIPGPLVGHVEALGLRFLPARHLRYRPAPSRIAQLAAIALRERIDLIHCYEWSTCLDAYYGAGLLLGTPMLCTVLSMQVMPQVPASVPLVMGTADLRDEALKSQTARVWVLEPPIDVERDHPDIDGSAFRHMHGVADNELLVVSVSRLALDLKIDALVRAIDAVDLLAVRHPVKLILVGDGRARDALDIRARTVNARHGRQVVSLPGANLDPRPAYAAADLVVGMGSSALRAMSIGKPVIVQGEEAFSEIFEPATYDLFLRQGLFGTADGTADATRLASQMESLLIDRNRRAVLGHFGRKVVTERFSLARAVDIQLDIYRQVIENPPRRKLSDAARSAGMALGLEIANHDPWRKRKRRLLEQGTLAAARSGPWPTAELRQWSCVQ